LDLYHDAELLFQTLGQEFNVPEVYELQLGGIDASPRTDSDIAALAMERAQALRLAATPRILTTADVVIPLAAQLARTLGELADTVTRPDSSHIMLVIRQKLNVVGQIMVDLDGSTDGPPTEFV